MFQEPGAVSGLTTKVTGDNLHVSWTALSPAPTNYRVKLFIGNIMQKVQTVVGASVDFPGVSTTTYYQVKVSAYTAPVDGLGGGYGPEVSTGMKVETKPTRKSYQTVGCIFSAAKS